MNSSRAGGQYTIITSTENLVLTVNKLETETKIKLSRWIFENNQAGVTPEINSALLEEVKSFRTPEIEDRALFLLQLCKHHSKYIGDVLNWASMSTRSGRLTSRTPPEIFAATYSLKVNEIHYLTVYLYDLGFITNPENHSGFAIEPKGYAFLNKTARTGGTETQAFVAMWFSEEMNDIYSSAIEPAIRESGFTACRIDKMEHNNKIDDEIIKEIRKSKFLVADFTSGRSKENILIPRGGVYFEAGFAQGLGIPVIWTCRADCINDVHFDTRQYNHIVWETPDELKEKLINRIGATIK